MTVESLSRKPDLVPGDGAMRRRWHEFDHVITANRDRWVASQAATLPRGARVLDIGAGPCRYRSLFDHCEYRAQDFAGHAGSTEGPLADAGAWRYGRLDYISDATAIPVEDASFDAVLCTEVLEHVPEPERVMREAARVLKPGGLLLVTAPLGSGLHQEPHHFFGGFTPYWYHRVLAAAGFNEITVTPNGGFFAHYAQESRRFSAWISPRRLPPLPAALLLPLWLVSVPVCRLLLPAACAWLDRFDTHRGFTVGYHITARRVDQAL
jgi:SAM-dependent methyltransferase